MSDFFSQCSNGLAIFVWYISTTLSNAHISSYEYILTRKGVFHFEKSIFKFIFSKKTIILFLNLHSHFTLKNKRDKTKAF